MIRCLKCKCPLSVVQFTLTDEGIVNEVFGNCFIHYTTGAEWDSFEELYELGVNVPRRQPIYESKFVGAIT